jgi:hypothetical protein
LQTPKTTIHDCTIFASQPSQSSSQDLCKTATHQHQKVILRLICMELPTSKNTNAHMTTQKLDLTPVHC